MTPTSGSMPPLFKKLLSGAKAFAQRAVVHVGAVFCGAAAAFASPDSTLITAFLGTYIGLISLIGADMSTKVSWIGPTVLGSIQAIVCISLGLPLHVGLFWGGVQAFIQRACAQRFALGYQWVTLLLLLPGAIVLGSGLFSSAIALISFLIFACGGGAFWLWYAMAYKVTPAANTKKTETAQTQQASTQHIPPQNGHADRDVLEEFQASVRKLRTKQILLPPVMQSSVKALAESATAILGCMAEDGRDVEPGKKFLKRYLTATHDVLDKYQRLRRDAAANPDATLALTQSEEVLVRLEHAFAQEHQALLRNDIDAFSADLKVLDTLLKMDGRYVS